MDERSFQPDWMSAPGATIADILKRRKLSAERFAELTGYSQEQTDRLLNGRTAITVDVAKLLARTIGGSASFWISREQQFREDVARLQSLGRRDAANIWLSELPVKDMIKLGWVNSETTIEGKIAVCLRFFGVLDVNAWRAKYHDLLSAVSFRTSPTYPSEPGAVLAWLRYGEIKAEEIECKDWNAEKFSRELSTIRKLTRVKDPRSFVPELRKICADCGVAVVIARAPTGCRASGATRFISPKTALVLLSFRYLSDDQFWFTFYHEAGHLMLHSHKALFLEDGSDVTLREENEANRFAENILVPQDARSRLPKGPMTMTDIMRLAINLGISRGIVVGQLQHMKRIEAKKFNWMKRRYRWDQIEEFKLPAK